MGWWENLRKGFSMVKETATDKDRTSSIALQRLGVAIIVGAVAIVEQRGCRF
jgi:hypothetical protein